MITLDELISDLQRLRKKTGQDMPVRIVIRDGEDGYQFTVQDTAVIDLTNTRTPQQKKYMVLVYAGDKMGSMDWPEDNPHGP